LFIQLGEKNQLPSLFHCTTGKDRTGWAAAALLTLLGVPEEKVNEDYLRSNEYILPAYKQAIDGFVVRGWRSLHTTGSVGRENRVSAVLVR
jgi:protein-tyrosine phosphatase